MTAKAKPSHTFVAVAAGLAALALAAPSARAAAVTWMINEDYQQRDARDATDFHMFLAGDVGARITGGGTTGVTNPFADPKVAIGKTMIGNTQVTFSGSNKIAMDPKANRHFGVYGSGAKPAVRLKAWSYATSPFLQPVPVANLGFSYSPSTDTMTVSVQNLSDDQIAASDVGFLVFSSEQPIEALNRTSLPPSSFNPISFLDHQYGVGDQASFTLTGILPTDFVVAYATLQFAGLSLANGYGDGTAGEWAQVSAASQAVPEPGLWAQMVLGFLVLGLAVRRRRRLVGLALLSGLALAAQPAAAWERGNHAGDWTKGGTIKVAVDTPPGDAAQQAAYLEAVAEAMAEWNDAQKPFGGLKLVLTTDPNPDVRVRWANKAAEWGSVAPGKGPVVLTQEADDGLNARGVTRSLKHEFGHVEGLGHSAASALMKADAYSSTPGQAPSAADLNSADPFIGPTADDLAGKKALWGTVEKLSKSTASSTTSFGGGLWHYDYVLQALAGYTDPVTRFTLDLPHGTQLGDLANFLLPQGWAVQFFSGDVTRSGPEKFLDDEASSPSLLSFYALSSSFGLQPGQLDEFGFASLLSPTMTRAFTNSPSYDSDESQVSAPGIPEPATWALMVLGVGLAGAALRRNSRRSPSGEAVRAAD